MTDKKISELTVLTEAALEDLLPIVDDPAGTPVTKRITLGNLLKAALMSFTPGGGIVAQTVQAAIAELDTKKAARPTAPTAGNFATLNSGGDPLDSGVSPSGVIRVAQFGYSFAAQGGAAGSTIALSALNGQVPANSVVWGGFIDVTTAVASSSSPNASLSLESGDDILAPANAVSTLSLGRKAIIPLGNVATAIKTTAARNLSLILSGTAPTNNLTDGVFRVVLFYIPVA